jgi:molecular chaperone HscA
VTVLKIGQVSKSTLDDASIRCDVHIEGKNGCVRFGDSAVKARAERGQPALYEPSPKLWLMEPDRLQDEVAVGLDISREQVLCGLLSYALNAAAAAGPMSEAVFEKLDIRIAHPVWPESIKLAANQALKRICAEARQVALKRRWDKLKTNAIRELLKTHKSSAGSIIDVVEPVAAATELLPDEDNRMRLCAVVDVGAGTTDIGLFRSLVPDEASKVASKLYPTGKPISVYKAGNAVDELVMRQIEAKARRRTRDKIEDVRSRIRGVKETLFKDGLIQELGCNVRFTDFQEDPEVQDMADEIRGSLVDLISANEASVSPLLNRSYHAVRHLDVIMAGGGGEMDFLLRALKAPVQIAGKLLPVRISVPGAKVGLDTQGASRARMAVALGGACPEYDQLIHVEPKLVVIRRGTI